MKIMLSTAFTDSTFLQMKIVQSTDITDSTFLQMMIVLSTDVSTSKIVTVKNQVHLYLIFDVNVF